MLCRLSCWICIAASAAIVAGCANVAPNSGFPPRNWLAVNGPIASDTRALPLLMDEGTFWRAVRPSDSEQGLAQSEWEAAYVALVPSKRRDGRTVEGPFSEPVAEALATCAPDFGSFDNETDWSTKSQLFRTGRVRIAGVAYYQYVVHSVTWSVKVSATGRGQRLSQLVLHSFGSFSPVPRSGTSKQVVRVAFGAPEHAPDHTSVVVIERADTAAVKASCSGGTLTLLGAIASASAGPWSNGILKQPFNVHIELQEEVRP